MSLANLEGCLGRTWDIEKRHFELCREGKRNVLI